MMPHERSAWLTTYTILICEQIVRIFKGGAKLWDKYNNFNKNNND